MEDDDQDRGDEENGQKVRHSNEKKRSMDEETTHGQTHDDMWMNMFLRDTSCVSFSHAVHVNKDEMCARKMRCVRVFCSHLSSVTVDRYQL